MTAPPRFATWLLETALPPGEADAVSGDLCEEFTLFVVPRRGMRAAYWWYCWQVARSLGPIVLRSWQRATVARSSAALVSAAPQTHRSCLPQRWPAWSSRVSGSVRPWPFVC
jgi:hypothetical protein